MTRSTATRASSAAANRTSTRRAQTNKLQVGLLLCFKERQRTVSLRITHVFPRRIYVMEYSTAAAARSARKPHSMTKHEVETNLAKRRSAWELRKAALPLAFHRRKIKDASNVGSEDEDASACKTIFNWIKPLIQQFDDERNLSRHRFTALIQDRSNQLAMDRQTLRRLVLRYYYFGRTIVALNPLIPGPEATTKNASNRGPANGQHIRVCHRKGRQPKIAKDVGPNTFIVEEQDKADMIKAVKRCSKKRSNLATVHDEYVGCEFARRHPKLYEDWLAQRCPLPVTYRQFVSYVKEHKDYEKRVMDNLPALAGNDPGRSSHASGPGEIYEIDATGARIHLVTQDQQGNPVLIGKPWIYLLIDRWSRFIVSVYITLCAPSWEEVRYALLCAFTPRVARYRALGIEVDEERWPQGRMCSAIAEDRGSEFLSKHNLEAMAHQLRIEPLTLPALTPDGKAVVERSIRDLKKGMVSSKLLGVYAKRPIDPPSKRAAKAAEVAAVESLQSAYRAILKVVDQKNNSPHRSLKRNLVLTQAGVRPTPKDAYIWGCEHLTGATVSPLMEEDYRLMLLSIGTGSIANSRLKFEGHLYEPIDASAHKVAAASTKRPHACDVRFDKTFREEVHVVSATGDWSTWSMVATDRLKVQGITMDEERALEEAGAMLWAKSENDARITRHVQNRKQNNRQHGTRRTQPQQQRLSGRPPARHAGREEAAALRKLETTEVKRCLTGRSSVPDRAASSGKKSSPSWAQLERAERLASVVRTSKRAMEGR